MNLRKPYMISYDTILYKLQQNTDNTHIKIHNFMILYYAKLYKGILNKYKKYNIIIKYPDRYKIFKLNNKPNTFNDSYDITEISEVISLHLKD